MNRFLLLTISILLLHRNTQAQTSPLTGTWSGPIMGIRLIFHFSKTPSGELRGTMDSPDQNATGLDIGQIILDKDSVTCILAVPPARYAAIRTDDTTLTGKWYQNGGSFPLTIHRTGGAENKTENQAENKTANQPENNTENDLKFRPQTPHPPYPYHSDSVEYDNAGKTVHLAGTLTYPEKGGPFPAAILITGSGIQDRDETVFGHKPFAVIADYLTKRGYAVLRVDDRTAGLSRGDVHHATSLVFAGDVQTSFDWLRTRKEIDPKKIGLIGHSEGAMIAPIVAAQNKDIAFIISLAGAVDGYQTLMYQTLEPLKRSHTGNLMIAFFMAREKMLLENMKTADDSAGFMQGLTSDYDAYYASIPDSLKPQYSFVPKPELFLHAIAPMAHSLVGPWWKFFLTVDMTHYYNKVKCPVLLLGGDKDIQVNNAVDLDAIASFIKENGNQRVETHLLPGLNHFFQHCHTCTVQEYPRLEETFSPEALKLMADWLDKNVR